MNGIRQWFAVIVAFVKFANSLSQSPVKRRIGFSKRLQERRNRFVSVFGLIEVDTVNH
jgi:hypothetical protein